MKKKKQVEKMKKQVEEMKKQVEAMKKLKKNDRRPEELVQYEPSTSSELR